MIVKRALTFMISLFVFINLESSILDANNYADKRSIAIEQLNEEDCASRFRVKITKKPVLLWNGLILVYSTETTCSVGGKFSCPIFCSDVQVEGK